MAEKNQPKRKLSLFCVCKCVMVKRRVNNLTGLCIQLPPTWKQKIGNPFDGAVARGTQLNFNGINGVARSAASDGIQQKWANQVKKWNFYIQHAEYLAMS